MIRVHGITSKLSPTQVQIFLEIPSRGMFSALDQRATNPRVIHFTARRWNPKEWNSSRIDSQRKRRAYRESFSRAQNLDLNAIRLHRVNRSSKLVWKSLELKTLDHRNSECTREQHSQVEGETHREETDRRSKRRTQLATRVARGVLRPHEIPISAGPRLYSVPRLGQSFRLVG